MAKLNSLSISGTHLLDERWQFSAEKKGLSISLCGLKNSCQIQHVAIATVLKHMKCFLKLHVCWNRFAVWCALLIVGLSCYQAASRPMGPWRDSPRNVILIIGDGMGLAQLSAAAYSQKRSMHWESMPVVGFIKTHAADNLITDSAAGATAFACGCKTYNNAIGMDSLGRACTNLFELLEQRGSCTGVIATAALTHATPAAFLAHQPHRTRYYAIAKDIVHSGVDFLVGGGLQYFTEREDGQNLKDSLRHQGVKVCTYEDGGLSWALMRKAHRFAWFAARNHPSAAELGRSYLASAVSLGARFLARCAGDRGFMLMVEGSQIDWGGHANDLHFILREIQDLDRAIGAALAFAQADGHTLVIVTADHETGGMSIPPPSRKRRIAEAFSTNSHTATMVPVFAYGPGAEQFGGIYDNTALQHKIAHLLGL